MKLSQQQIDDLIIENTRLKKEIIICYNVSNYVKLGLNSYLNTNSHTKTEEVLKHAIETLHGIINLKIRKKLQLKDLQISELNTELKLQYEFIERLQNELENANKQIKFKD